MRFAAFPGAFLREITTHQFVDLRWNGGRWFTVQILRQQS